jgi:O-antigen/teichoic acid export membrane protein
MKIINIQNLFLKNIGLKQTVLKNTFWLVLAEGISRLLEFVLIVYIIKILGAEEFGKFSFSLAFASIFVVLSDFGIADITTREFSRDPKNEKEYSTIFSSKILLSIGAFILMLIGSFLITPDLVIQKVIWILAIYILVSDFFFIIYAFLRARQKMEYEAGIKILRALITLTVGFFILYRCPSIGNISYGYLIANLIALTLVLLLVYFYIYKIKLSLDRTVLQKFFKFSWPLGLTAIFGAIFLNMDSVIMGYLGQIAENGWYGAARRIISFTIIPATLVLASFYPVLSKLFEESKEKLQKVWDYYMESMIILAIPITVGGLVFAQKIIDFIYGTDFNPSVLAFKILIFTTGIGFICNPYMIILIVSNHQKKYLLVSLIAVIANIIANIILIPRYSLYGASIASVITNIVILLLGIEFSRRFVAISIFNLKLFKTMIVAAISSAVMFIAITQPLVYNLNILMIVFIGMMVYFLSILCIYKFFNKFKSLGEIHLFYRVDKK